MEMCLLELSISILKKAIKQLNMTKVKVYEYRER